MIKNLIYISFICLFSFSCEDDDICDESYTSRLRIDFKDISSKNTITIDTLYVIQEFTDGSIGFIENATNEKNSKIFPNKSEIYIPLNLTGKKLSKLIFYDRYKSTITSEIEINYNLNETYVSKACGFKYTFTDLTTNLIKNNFINSITQNTNEINDEFSSHLTIFK